MISMVSIGTKNAGSKLGLHWYSKNGHSRILEMFSLAQSHAFVMQYIKVSLHCQSSFHNEKYALTLIVINSDVTSNLRTKKMSVSQVDDWKISIPSFDIFPTVPIMFDEVYWEAYWPIVNKPMLEVREILTKLEKEIRDNEMKKMAENKRKLEKDEAERLETQKKQDELRLRKRKKSLSRLLNHHYPTHRHLFQSKLYPLSMLNRHLQVMRENQQLLQ